MTIVNVVNHVSYITPLSRLRSVGWGNIVFLLNWALRVNLSLLLVCVAIVIVSVLNNTGSQWVSEHFIYTNLVELIRLWIKLTIIDAVLCAIDIIDLVVDQLDSISCPLSLFFVFIESIINVVVQTSVILEIVWIDNFTTLVQAC
jgi:hypothetical protein